MSGLSRTHEMPEIHRAEWIVPVSTPPLDNGAVLTHGGRVIAAGPFPAVRREAPAGVRLVDHGQAALFPALVNAHTHLEFSALKGRIPLPQPGFREWIEILLPLRAGLEPESIHAGLRKGETELFSSGTGLFADITNGSVLEDERAAQVTVEACPGLRSEGLSGHPGGRPTYPCPERRIFLELLGFNLDSVEAATPPWPGMHYLFQSRDKHGKRRQLPEATADLDGCPTAIPVPHSVYSVSASIISETKEWTRVRGLPFSIHVAEHWHEIEFLRSGEGFCRELLERLGRWDQSWAPPGKTPVEYLDFLGVLDPLTLLVHAVCMTEADWAIAAKRRCTVVFCPRSNRNLGSGRPWIEKALSLGIRCALGTDSLASNTDLNLFAEAGFTLNEHPSIDPRRVLEMITVNPAGSLGLRSNFGSIEPGAAARLLAVETGSGVNESNLAEALIQSGKEGALKWLNCAQS